MEITREKLRRQWWEDADGNFVAEVDYATMERPHNAVYLRSRVPLQLTDEIIRVDPSGKATEVGTGTSTFSEDLVLALAYENNGMDLGDAIIFAADSCERCNNAMAHQLGLEWGYPEYGEEWRRSPTECDFCVSKEIAATRWPNGTRVSIRNDAGITSTNTGRILEPGRHAEVVAQRSLFDEQGNFTEHAYGLRLDPDVEREEGDSGELVHWIPESRLALVEPDQPQPDLSAQPQHRETLAEHDERFREGEEIDARAEDAARDRTIELGDQRNVRRSGLE